MAARDPDMPEAQANLIIWFESERDAESSAGPILSRDNKLPSTSYRSQEKLL